MMSFLKKLFSTDNSVAEVIKQGAIIIDIRTKSEFDAGHIDGSRNIPLDRIKPEIGQIKQLQKPIVTVCRSGSRSVMAQSTLKAAGVTVYNGGSYLSVKKQLLSTHKGQTTNGI